MTKISVTKLTLLVIVVGLLFIEIWRVVHGGDYSDLFSNVAIAVISYYFAQKGIKYDNVDSIVEETEKTEEKSDTDTDTTTI